MADLTVSISAAMELVAQHQPPPPPSPSPRETPETNAALVARGWGILQVGLVPGVGGGVVEVSSRARSYGAKIGVEPHGPTCPS